MNKKDKDDTINTMNTMNTMDNKKKTQRFLNSEITIYASLEFINGNIFYSIEYYFYLRKYFKNVNLIIDCKPYFRKKILEKWEDKYCDFTIIEINNELNKSIFFNKKFISNITIILDYSSWNSYIKNKNISKLIVYNYGDDEKSLKEPMSEELKKKYKVITIGDKDIGCLVEVHQPLRLNFELFKDFKKFQPKIFIEHKNEDIYDRKREIKNFHESFDLLFFDKKNFWERANRLIPECKYYNKKILYYSHDKQIDSADLRHIQKWEFYSLNHENPNIENFSKFIKKLLLIIKRKDDDYRKSKKTNEIKSITSGK